MNDTKHRFPAVVMDTRQIVERGKSESFVLNCQNKSVNDGEHMPIVSRNSHVDNCILPWYLFTTLLTVNSILFTISFILTRSKTNHEHFDSIPFHRCRSGIACIIEQKETIIVDSSRVISYDKLFVEDDSSSKVLQSYE